MFFSYIDILANSISIEDPLIQFVITTSLLLAGLGFSIADRRKRIKIRLYPSWAVPVHHGMQYLTRETLEAPNYVLEIQNGPRTLEVVDILVIDEESGKICREAILQESEEWSDAPIYGAYLGECPCTLSPFQVRKFRFKIASSSYDKKVLGLVKYNGKRTKKSILIIIPKHLAS